MKTRIPYQQRMLEISYFVRQGEKETIVFFHGLGCSKDDFAGAMDVEGLKPYTLVGFDFPGCGGSTYPEGASFSLDDLARIADAVVTELGFESFLLAGHSMGGAVALLYLKEHPEKVKAFINIEGNLTPENCRITRLALQRDFEDFFSTIYGDLIKELYKKNNPGFSAWASYLENTSSPRAFFDYCPSLVACSDSGCLLNQFINLTIPKIYIFGSEDRQFTYLAELAAKGCELSKIPESSHFPFYDNPEIFYQAVSNFLCRSL